MKYTTLLNQLDEYLFTYTIDNKILTLNFNHITLTIKHKGIISHTYTLYCDYNYYDTPKVVGTRHTQESLATLIKFFIKFYPYEYIQTIIHNTHSSIYLYNIKDKYNVHYDYPNQKVYFIDTQTHKQVGRTTKELTLSQLYDLEMELYMKVNEAEKHKNNYLDTFKKELNNYNWCRVCNENMKEYRDITKLLLSKHYKPIDKDTFRKPYQFFSETIRVIGKYIVITYQSPMRSYEYVKILRSYIELKKYLDKPLDYHDKPFWNDEADKSNIFNYAKLLEANGYYYTTNYTYEKDFGTYTKVITLKDHNDIIVTYKNTDNTSFTLNNYYQLGDELKMDKEKVKITLEDCKLQEVSLDIKPASCYNYSGTTKATIKEDIQVDKMKEVLKEYGYSRVDEDIETYGHKGNLITLTRDGKFFEGSKEYKTNEIGNTIEELQDYLDKQVELDKIKLVLSVYDYFLDFKSNNHVYFKNNKGSYVAINKGNNRIYEGTQPLLVNLQYVGNTSKDLNNYLGKQEKIERIREAVKELVNYKEYDSNKAYLSFVDESNQINIQYIKDNIHVFIPNTKLSVSENANVEYKEDIIEQVKELEEYLLDKSNQELTTQDMIDKLKEQGYKVIKEY